MPHSTEHLKRVSAMITSAFKQMDSRAGNPPKINPIIEGSMGLLLHDVPFKSKDNPGDIDILITNLAEARKAINLFNKHLQKKNSPYEISAPQGISGARVVQDYLVIDKTGKNPPLAIQLVDIKDFGLINVKTVEVGGIPVLSVKDALISLEHRMRASGPRPKDQFAYFTLIEKHGHELLKDEEFAKDEARVNFIKSVLEKKPTEHEKLGEGAKSTPLKVEVENSEHSNEIEIQKKMKETLKSERLTEESSVAEIPSSSQSKL